MGAAEFSALRFILLRSFYLELCICYSKGLTMRLANQERKHKCCFESCKPAAVTVTQRLMFQPVLRSYLMSASHATDVYRSSSGYTASARRSGATEPPIKGTLAQLAHTIAATVTTHLKHSTYILLHGLLCIAYRLAQWSEE